MGALHRAALIRAYRTLAQGLGGSAVSTALVAVITSIAGGETGQTALVAAGASIGTVIVAAFGSFWQGVAQGLPEVDPRTETERLADEQADADRRAIVAALDYDPRIVPGPDADGHVRWAEPDTKGKHEA